MLIRMVLNLVWVPRIVHQVPIQAPIEAHNRVTVQMLATITVNMYIGRIAKNNIIFSCKTIPM
jgi:hypothetical protein